MNKMELVLKSLVGKNLRARHIIKQTGLSDKLVYQYLRILLDRGKIKRTNEESPYYYTADNVPEVMLLNLWNILAKYYTRKSEKDYYGNYQYVSMSKEDFEAFETIEKFLERKFE